jgi:hypothetical protein
MSTSSVTPDALVFKACRSELKYNYEQDGELKWLVEFFRFVPGADVNNPSDLTAKRIVWIGKNPDSPYQYGAYFKGPVWIGGTNTGNAPFVADSSGNLSLNGTLSVTGTARSD